LFLCKEKEKNKNKNKYSHFFTEQLEQPDKAHSIRVRYGTIHGTIGRFTEQYPCLTALKNNVTLLAV
jgi:hypothetical protein